MSSLSLEEINFEMFDYVFKNNQNFFFVTLVSRGNFCPVCHTFSKKVHGYKDKKIKHSILLKEPFTVIYHQRRYICPQCGKTFIERCPFISSNTKISQKTIHNTLSLLKDYNQTFSSAARLVNLSVTEVIDIFDQYVQIERKPLHEIICIDEFYFSRHSKNKFACLLISFKNGLILDVLESRKKSYLRSYFRMIDPKERYIVRFVSSAILKDMKCLGTRKNHRYLLRNIGSIVSKNSVANTISNSVQHCFHEFTAIIDSLATSSKNTINSIIICLISLFIPFRLGVFNQF